MKAAHTVLYMKMHTQTGVLKISLAGANNSVPTTGLTPCIIIVMYIHVITAAPKKHRRPLAFRGAVNGIIAPILHPCTNVRFLFCDGHQLYERGVDLEVEGVRYIEMHRGPAAYVLGPPPSRSRDLELEGGVIACHVDYVYEPQDSHVRGTE